MAKKRVKVNANEEASITQETRTNTQDLLAFGKVMAPREEDSFLNNFRATIEKDRAQLADRLTGIEEDAAKSKSEFLQNLRQCIPAEYLPVVRQEEHSEFDGHGKPESKLAASNSGYEEAVQAIKDSRALLDEYRKAGRKIEKAYASVRANLREGWQADQKEITQILDAGRRTAELRAKVFIEGREPEETSEKTYAKGERPAPIPTSRARGDKAHEAIDVPNTRDILRQAQRGVKRLTRPLPVEEIDDF